MSELVLELSLKRSSGVLAGIVAALGQAGIHLQTQKLDRSGTGWLTIHAEGDPPDPAALIDRLNGTRGVDRLVRLSIDGETVIEDGAPVAPATETDPIRAEDLAKLSAGAARKSVPDEADESRALDEAPAFIDDADTSEAPAESSRHRPSNDPALEDQTPEVALEPVMQTAIEAHSTESADKPSGDDSDPQGAPGEPDNEERLKLNLRRRRRRRR